MKNTRKEYIPRLGVVGVGGMGCKATMHVMEDGLHESVSVIMVNTDAQEAIDCADKHKARVTMIILDEGNPIGAGGDPERAKDAAGKQKNQIKDALKDIDLAIIFAGMGGGTGSGASPVIAEIAKDMKIPIMALVTRPFTHELSKRMKIAEEGIVELEKAGARVLIIDNSRILEEDAIMKLDYIEALKEIDKIHFRISRFLIEAQIKPGINNMDLSDFKSILMKPGKGTFGWGEVKESEKNDNNILLEAARKAMDSRLMELPMNDAGAIGIGMMFGEGVSLRDVAETMDEIVDVVGQNADVKQGIYFEKERTSVEVFLLATGLPNSTSSASVPGADPQKIVPIARKRGGDGDSQIPTSLTPPPEDEDSLFFRKNS